MLVPRRSKYYTGSREEMFATFGACFKCSTLTCFGYVAHKRNFFKNVFLQVPGVPEDLHITFSSINQKVYIAGRKT